MELVYLWVEDYKNIKKQGFNFSPRFDCQYDEDTKNLNIVDKEKTGEFYPKNLFGENINITAIVGENGSGKSSIVSSIFNRQKMFIVAFENNELVVYRYKVNVNTKLSKERIGSKILSKILYYSMDSLSPGYSNRIKNSIKLENTNRIITENYKELQKVEFRLFNFVPTSIKFPFIMSWIDSHTKISDMDIDEIRYYLDWDEDLSRNEANDNIIIRDTLSALKNIKDEYLLYLLSRIADVQIIFEFINLTEYYNSNSKCIDISITDVKNVLDEYKIKYLNQDRFELVIKYAGKVIEIKHLEEVLGKEYLTWLFSESTESFEFDFKAENGATYNLLSHGEKTIYSFFVSLVSSPKDEFFLFLDEPDNTLHPDWQKSFLNELMKIIEDLNKKVHIVITSHSPFILSDLPKENVIFLKDGKQIDALEKKQTFGANIHTLLSDGFFMDGGLMGEFAKGKIDEVIELLNEKGKLEEKELKRCKDVVSIVGEPILKKQLQRMLNNKLELSNKDEIDIIKEQMKELTNRLSEIENDSN